MSVAHVYPHVTFGLKLQVARASEDVEASDSLPTNLISLLTAMTSGNREAAEGKYVELRSYDVMAQSLWKISTIAKLDKKVRYEALVRLESVLVEHSIDSLIPRWGEQKFRAFCADVIWRFRTESDEKARELLGKLTKSAVAQRTDKWPALARFVQEAAASEDTIDRRVDAHPFTFCGANIDLKQADNPAAERVWHTLHEADRSFLELDQDRRDYDVIVEIGGEKMRAHKELLIVRIPFFRGLFSHSFVESSSDMIPLVFDYCEFDPAYVRAIIRSFYDGHVDLSTDNLDSWLEAAMYLSADTIIEACCRFLLKRVRCDDALLLLRRFRSVGCHALNGRLWRFIDANFVPISLSAEFKEMSVDELIEIIRRHSLRVDSEQQVLEAVDRWMQVDCARWPEGARLLNYVRLSSLPIRHIEKVIDSLDWVKANPSCLELLSENKSPEHRADRYCKDRVALLCAADTGRQPQHRDEDRVRTYNVLANEWTVAPLPEYIFRETPCVAIGPKLYYLGTQGEPTRVLDTATNEWSELPSMDEGYRDWPAVGVINDVIYVAGGDDPDDLPTSTLIAMDTKAANPVWEQRAPMMLARWHAASCVHKGRLYVFGGLTDPHSKTAAAACYDPASDQWHSVAPMRRATYVFSAAAGDDRIYVIGILWTSPWTSPQQHFFEAYDPATDTWMQMPAPVLTDPGRYCVVVAGGRLLAWNLEDRQLKTFKIESNVWTTEMCLYGGDAYLSTTWMFVPASTPLPLAAIEEPFYMMDETRRA